jgi:hypothetical protein
MTKTQVQGGLEKAQLIICNAAITLLQNEWKKQKKRIQSPKKNKNTRYHFRPCPASQPSPSVPLPALYASCPDTHDGRLSSKERNGRQQGKRKKKKKKKKSGRFP